jgi:hypothetical protein
LLPRNRGIFQTKTANQTGNVQVTDGHRELVVNPRNANTSITGKRMERLETTSVKIATVLEGMETEIGTAVEEKGMPSARKVGIEVNESWIGTRGTKTAFETIVGHRRDRTVQVQDRMVQDRMVQGRMVHRHHLVEETVLLPKVEGTVQGMVHLKGSSGTMGVSQTIGAASLFGTSVTLHSALLHHHVVGGTVIAVKASVGIETNENGHTPASYSRLNK